MKKSLLPGPPIDRIYTYQGIYMKLAEMYQCLCDETRLRIVHLLTAGPLCVCHFQEILRLPQVQVSKRLGYLRRHGLVETTRHHRWMIYALPRNRKPELEIHLRCLLECALNQPQLRVDSRRRNAIAAKNDWVETAWRKAKAS